MEEFLDQKPDAATPLNSVGNFGNAAGNFDLKKVLRRKIKSRKDLSQPKFAESGPMATPGGGEENATDRYFGAFSISAKRDVFDLLANHPKFDQKGSVRMNRIENNTRKVMPNDAIKTSDRYY